MNPRIPIILGVLLIVLTPIVAACSTASDQPQVELELAPESALPDFVQTAPPQVKEAYRFAIANPDVLSNFPCYCGCGAVGHQNNRDCYIKEIRSDGSIEFDNHAFG